MRSLLLLVTCASLVAPLRAGATTELQAEAAPPESGIPLRVRTLDVSADTLPAGQGEFHLGWLAYHRGILPGLTLSTHGLAWLGTVANLTARVQLVDREELRLTAQLGGFWLLGGTLYTAIAAPEATTYLFSVPGELRASVPVADRVELNFAALGTGLWGSVGDLLSASGISVAAEAGVGLYDDHGAWLFVGRLPLMARQSVSSSGTLGLELAGTVVMDDLTGWSVLVARDQVFGDTLHGRVGMGWRGRPGLFMLEGIGSFVVQLDVYWR